MWKSVKLSRTPIRQYFCTSGLVYEQSSGNVSGQMLLTQLKSLTTLGGCTNSESLENQEFIPLYMYIQIWNFKAEKI